jgi:hypothetical protein
MNLDDFAVALVKRGIMLINVMYNENGTWTVSAGGFNGESATATDSILDTAVNQVLEKMASRTRVGPSLYKAALEPSSEKEKVGGRR